MAGESTFYLAIPITYMELDKLDKLVTLTKLTKKEVAAN